MKNCSFMVVWVTRLKLFHRSFISQCASAVVNLVGVLVKRLDGGNVVPLPLRFGTDQFCFLHNSRTRFQVGGTWRRPNLMVVRHGNSPVRHAAGGVFLRYSSEGIVGLLVPKRMEHRYGTAELRLNRWIAGNLKIHLA